MPAVHLLIRGKVQGVFYRATASDMATELGLCGWVRNTSEGHVEALVQGPEPQVQAFIEWARKGPPKAAVTHLDIQSVPDQPLEGFRIRRG